MRAISGSELRVMREALGRYKKKGLQARAVYKVAKLLICMLLSTTQPVKISLLGKENVNICCCYIPSPRYTFIMKNKITLSRLGGVNYAVPYDTCNSM